MISCEFNTAKKIQNPEKKYEKALEYYEAGKYAKAQILLEDVILSLRMTKSGEDALYKFADSYYHLKDYILAGYYFRKYVSDYPKGKHAEESQFMSAKCYYLDAPKPKLDQEATYTALKEFELFITKYPESDKIEDCNKMVDDLIARLETKSFLNAKLYYDIGYYNAASIALKNSIKDYPDTKYKEEIMYLIVKSRYKYAQNSIISKQKERYENTLKAYNDFIEKYPESKYLKELNGIKKTINKELTKLNTDTETANLN
ncbi:MAG: outer membrane protein assembly factor BamD [Chlorobi bacterium]|nr:outer membrane protein assembly factor BamD [Chlorobiota bacterium]